MQYNPRTGNLFSDTGRFLKNMSCPKVGQALALSNTVVKGQRLCGVCHKLVLDAALVSEVKIEEALSANPDQCISIPHDHSALKVIFDDPKQQT